MPPLYQIGELGAPPHFRKFFDLPPISLDEMRGWINEAAGHDAIGLGGVVDASGHVVGEMVMMGDHAYLVGVDGAAKPLPANHKIIFAQIGHMQPQESHALRANNLADLKAQLQDLLPNDADRNAYMVRLHGTFPRIQFRSASAQGERMDSLAVLTAPPYVKNFDFADTTFDLAGFYSRKGAVDDEVTLDDALHLHGLDHDHKKGGHMLDFTGPIDLQVEIMPITQWLTATQNACGEPSWVDRLKPAKTLTAPGPRKTL